MKSTLRRWRKLKTRKIQQVRISDTIEVMHKEAIYTPSDPLSLADWRRQVSEMYAKIRADKIGSASTWEYFRIFRDSLFKNHVQSPLDAEQKKNFHGVQYFKYDAAYRVVGKVKPAARQYFKVEEMSTWTHE